MYISKIAKFVPEAFLFACVVFFETKIYHLYSDEHLIEVNVARFFLIGLLTFTIFAKTKSLDSQYRIFITSVSSAVLMFPIFIWAMAYISLGRLNWLTQEDFIIENLSAIFLFIASTLMLVASLFLLKSYGKFVSLTSLMIGVVFFIIGMEEISWMQRIIGVESTGVFLEKNFQEETNIHNFDSVLSNNIYAIGAFVALTLAPFYSNKITSIFKKVKIPKMSILIPSRWIFVPFAVAAGFVFPPQYLGPIIVALLLATIGMLFDDISIRLLKTRGIDVLYPLTAVIVLIITVGVSMFHNSEFASNTFYEVRELVVAFGLSVYSLDLIYRILIDKSAKKADEKSRKNKK